jgi:hypothetical protein
MKLPSFLALNADHRSIGGFHVGFSIQGYPHGKASVPIVSNDLNASDGLTTGPLSYSLKALFPQSRVVEADCAVMKYHHAGIRIWRPSATRRKRLKQHHSRSPQKFNCSGPTIDPSTQGVSLQVGQAMTGRRKRVDTLALARSGWLLAWSNLKRNPN